MGTSGVFLMDRKTELAEWRGKILHRDLLWWYTNL